MPQKSKSVYMALILPRSHQFLIQGQTELKWNKKKHAEQILSAMIL